ncbi:M20/M25/M40 family metallo-hydrolase [bacterium]|nr:M20/M25/M40 family metallo-hydrolase [bacterium]
MEKNWDFLKRLCETPSPAGFESKAVEVFLEYLKPIADETLTDSYGSGVAILNPQGSPRVYVCGHADEIGFIINHIDENGFASFTQLGGWDKAVVAGRRVIIYTQDGREVPGVIGSTAIHMKDAEERKKLLDLHKLFIDIGAKDADEAREHIGVGDVVVMDYPFIELLNGRFVSKALDNKTGCWCAAEVLRTIAEGSEKTEACIIAGANVMEEIGGHGANMLAQSQSPDCAVVYDVTQSTDTPGLEKSRVGDIKMGAGPVASLGSANNLAMFRKFQDAAKKLEMDVQTEINAIRTGTDADSVFRANGGIPSIVISPAERYMHTPVEMLEKKDLEEIVQLTVRFILDLKPGEKITPTPWPKG